VNGEFDGDGDLKGAPEADTALKGEFVAEAAGLKGVLEGDTGANA
jgi:hypothetical protein